VARLAALRQLRQQPVHADDQQAACRPFLFDLDFLLVSGLISEKEL